MFGLMPPQGGHFRLLLGGYFGFRILNYLNLISAYNCAYSLFLGGIFVSFDGGRYGLLIRSREGFKKGLNIILVN